MSSSSVAANSQAQVLLQTLYGFMLPLIQTALGQATDPKNICFGIEAAEFVSELEKFISSMISRSQLHNQDIAIETRLGKDSFYYPEEDEVTRGAHSLDEGSVEHIPMNQSLIQHPAVPRSLPLGSTEEDLGNCLQDIRKHVIQKMPIRLLCFEPHNSKLKISLFERADIYNYLALKFQADFKESSQVVYSWTRQHAGYAILSHTWNQTPGELTYGDWKNGSLDAMRPKCRKLVNFCKAAWEDYSLTLGWIDTVCINKESSAELDESIRSMYTWYRNAEICITYLAGSKTMEEIHNDSWFTRGWTLQELVAPERIKFYNMDWNRLCSDKDHDDKANRSIQAEIMLATTMTRKELQYFWGTSISRRMQLAAKREVTRGEDIAYCLMGIFDVSISTAYGEGAGRAFFRLVEEIFRSTKDVSDIFNWAGDKPSASQGRASVTSIFPFHPSNYLNRSSNERLRSWRPIEPLTLTHLGLRMPVLLMPAVPYRELDLPHPPPVGDYHAAVTVTPSVPSGFYPFGNLPNNYLLLASGPKGMHIIEVWYGVMLTLTFGTLNVEEHGTSIRIPKTCLAVLVGQVVEPSPTGYEKLCTKDPIVFDLQKTGSNFYDDESDDNYYQIERSQLANHGMQLVTSYL